MNGQRYLSCLWLVVLQSHMTFGAAAGPMFITFKEAPLGQANSYIERNLGWLIEEERKDGLDHFTIVDDSDLGCRVLRTDMHSWDGDGLGTDRAVGRQELKPSFSSRSALQWARSIPSQGSGAEWWQYDLVMKLADDFGHKGPHFYHLFQLKFDKLNTHPLLTFGTKKGSLGVYTKMGHEASDQIFTEFMLTKRLRGKWINVRTFVYAASGPHASIQVDILDFKTGEHIYRSPMIRGSIDWAGDVTVWPKFGQYYSYQDKPRDNIVYFLQLTQQ